MACFTETSRFLSSEIEICRGSAAAMSERAPAASTDAANVPRRIWRDTPGIRSDTGSPLAFQPELALQSFSLARM